MPERQGPGEPGEHELIAAKAALATQQVELDTVQAEAA
jgi:hypothetical protein